MRLNNKPLRSATATMSLAVLFSLSAGLDAFGADEKTYDLGAGPTTNPASQPVNPDVPTPPASSIPPPPLPTDRSFVRDDNPHYDPSIVPHRPKPIIEIGNPFFGTGLIHEGITLPTGEVISPTFLVYGEYRSAFQGFENPRQDPPGAQNKPRTEWANRLDLFGNLYLSGTERVLIGIRPLDDGEFAKPQKARYSGVNFTPGGTEGGIDAINSRITTLFFEGDLGQIFPRLDPFDGKQLDIGFSVGRQPLLYQDGLLINDDMDAVGVTRNTFPVEGGSNLQLTALYAWNQIQSNDGINHHQEGLLGFFVNADIFHTTWNLDTAYVFGNGNRELGSGNGDAIFGALSATQQIGELNTTFRILGSKALYSGTPTGDSLYSQFGNGSTAVGNGVLLFSAISWTPSFSKDLAYIDAYWGIDRFTSAARGPERGGPLGSVGILFAEQPIGRYGSALSSNPDRSVGAAIGYQKYLDETQRRQIIFEVGGRASTDNSASSAIAAGARYQQAFGQHWVLQFDTFAALNEARGPGYGGRAELRLEF